MAVTPIRKSEPQPVWLSAEQVAAKVPGLTVVKLADMRDRRTGPAYYKPTVRTVVYLESEINAWIAQTRVATNGGQP